LRIKRRIFDGDERVREMPAGEVGEICFAAPQLTAGSGIVRRETAAVLREYVEADSVRHYLHTVDLGFPGRRRLRLHCRSQEGPHQDVRAFLP